MVTSRGWGMAAAGAVLLGVGFWLGYPEPATIGTAAVTAFLVALLVAGWRPKLTVTRGIEPERVERGEACTVTLTVRNDGKLRAVSMVAHDICDRMRVPVPLHRVRPRKEATVDYRVPTERRGVMRLGPLTVGRRDPLGLVKLARSYGDPGTVWVHPVVHPLYTSPQGVARSMDGQIDRIEHGSLTFHALREYVVGDDLRHVHWRTSARIGDLMIREHMDTSLPHIVVLLDDRAQSYRHDGFETACEAAASVVVAALREGLSVAMTLTSGRTIVTGGRDDYLDALSEAELTVDEDALNETVNRLRHQRLGDTLIYLTGSGRPLETPQLASLRGGHPAILAAVLGPGNPGHGTVGGFPVLGAADGREFAAAWHGAGAW
ncbi:DUF58 domain-containing protein [Phytomonospora endophytica]|uniref:Uncharacterized protein (DUF58 family) n=1 Tax=Phytomonospora endophytica TaxID=714109 RepID=A0A841FQG8_9ACTN|nr:DUF58 domain-containing protein [Phytomonospora endophytica]MBB6038084.1 uncharacterized protein (DUF58 family) [Phytomonospora endophytica]